MTDITGFGLLGHADEVARAGGVGLRLDAERVPILDGALECVALDVNTGGAGRNEAYTGPRVSFAADVSPAVRAVLWDPQTAGGLLITARPEVGAELERSFAQDGVPLWRIGVVTEGDGIVVTA